MIILAKILAKIKVSSLILKRCEISRDNFISMIEFLEHFSNVASLYIEIELYCSAGLRIFQYPGTESSNLLRFMRALSAKPNYQSIALKFKILIISKTIENEAIGIVEKI